MAKTIPDFFSDPSVIEDSRGYFDLVRSIGPVVREPFHDTLVITGFEEALEILNDKGHVWSNACSIVGPMPGLPFQVQGNDIREQLDRHRATMPWADHLVCMDGKR